MFSLVDIEEETKKLLIDAPAGDGLSPLAASLISLAVKVSVTSLRADCLPSSIGGARMAGATTEQIQEIISLVSGLGVHSLMISSSLVLNSDDVATAMDEERQRLWAQYVGEDPYWADFEAELPGFLKSLLHLSPSGFRAFFEYCAVPWATRHVKAVTKELAAMACDATPGHRFGPGFRLHLKNALKLGAGTKAIYESLKIAASAPEHKGIP